MTPEQTVKWTDPLRVPFHLFASLQEELAMTTAFRRNRTPHERLEYLEFMRCVIFGEDVVNAKMVRCYGRHRPNEEADPKDIVYF